jgi:hypothetical protein
MTTWKDVVKMVKDIVGPDGTVTVDGGWKFSQPRLVVVVNGITTTVYEHNRTGYPYVGVWYAEGPPRSFPFQLRMDDDKLFYGLYELITREPYRNPVKAARRCPSSVA